MERIPVEQDSSVLWDEAVLNLRAGNEDWIAGNLAEWVSEYFGHDRVFLLDADDNLIRSVAGGALADPEIYFTDYAYITPLVEELRADMAKASSGLSDSTDGIADLGVQDVVSLAGGIAAIVSVRPVVPDSDQVFQAPGTEFLHISLRILDKTVTDEISEHYEIPGLEFHMKQVVDGEHIATRIIDRNGNTVGFFDWLPEEPAYELIAETIPFIGIGVIVGSLLVFLLLLRLKRASAQLEESQAQASFLAFHDPMTRIPNRSLFEDRLTQALANMRGSSTQIALHYIDLDSFKRVNDTLGHAAGDQLLCEAAGRLLGLVTDVDTVARLGGDEFAVIQFCIPNANAAFILSQQIVEAFQSPFMLSGQKGDVGASVGVTIVNDPSLRPEDAMNQADIALYEAKKSGKGQFQIYDGDVSIAVQERRTLEKELLAALNGAPGLELVYQPIFASCSGEIVGAEALVRWQNPRHGLMPPIKFIGLAEDRGIIDELGIWVLHEACSYAAGSSVPWVAVNVSPLQFQDEKFAERVFEVLHSTGLEASRLELEITEGLLLQNSPVIQSTLVQLRKGGIRIALDDFGTGYSSISYLRTHGVDKLKIDQSYTAQLGLDREIDSIVRSIVDLGRAMSMTVTAEGVETQAQREKLHEIGCEQLQGYLLSRPVSAADLSARLVEHSFLRQDARTA